MRKSLMIGAFAILAPVVAIAQTTRSDPHAGMNHNNAQVANDSANTMDDNTTVNNAAGNDSANTMTTNTVDGDAPNAM